jgi:CHASE2 domain-containing sensor protein
VTIGARLVEDETAALRPMEEARSFSGHGAPVAVVNAQIFLSATVRVGSHSQWLLRASGSMASFVQNLKKRLAENWRNGVIGAASAVLLGWCFLVFPLGPGRTLGDGLKNWSYDFLIRYGSKARANDVAIVLMDEASREALGQSPNEPWHRALHAALVDELEKRGAKAVIFDILWDDPRVETTTSESKLSTALQANPRFRRVEVIPGQAAQQLAAAMRSHGKVIVGASAEYMREPEMTVLHEPVEPIRGAAADWGIVELSKSSDGKVRIPHYDVRYSNFAWKAAEVLRYALPENPWAPRWIRYYGPSGTIPRYSFYQVLETNGVPPDAFTDKVVFVGRGRIIDAKDSRGDIFETPMGEMPGVEIQATVFLNLCQRDYLVELSPWTEFLLLFGLGTILGFVLVLMRPWIAASMAATAFALLMITSLHLASRQHLWFPWLIVGAVQIPCALGWAVLANTRKVYHEKEVLEQTLATAHLQPASAEKTVATVAAAPTPAPRALPKTMADHELVRYIGGGAYGEVWLARNVIGLYRAFKIIRRDKFRDEGPFQREFRGLEKYMPISMSHPGLVQVLHVGKNDAEGFFYYIMETGDDEATGQRIDAEKYSPKNLATESRRRKVIPVLEAIDIVAPLCDALDYMHRQQLIHRDIKPSNVIFVNGVPKLADIGLVTGIAGTDRDVSWVGTDGYIPPEGPGTPAADVYSLGKVLYEITLGMDPRHWPALPTALVEGAERVELFALNDLLLKACAEQRQRYKSAAELRADLLRLRGEITGRAQTRT